jgi:hypothetical protein
MAAPCHVATAVPRARAPLTLKVKLAKARGRVTFFGGPQRFYHQNARIDGAADPKFPVLIVYDMDYT